MEKSNLIPFLRGNLHILFVGLNPAKGSSDNGHYFSVKQSLWNQLYESGLLIQPLEKSNADELAFGNTICNYRNWGFGVTDLITEIAESNSGKIKPTLNDFKRLEDVIKAHRPLIVVLIHGKVLKGFLKYLNRPAPRTNTGILGKLIEGIPTTFFNIAFPHGNSISDLKKIMEYRQLKDYIETLQ